MHKDAIISATLELSSLYQFKAGVLQCFLLPLSKLDFWLQCYLSDSVGSESCSVTMISHCNTWSKSYLSIMSKPRCFSRCMMHCTCICAVWNFDDDVRVDCDLPRLTAINRTAKFNKHEQTWTLLFYPIWKRFTSWNMCLAFVLELAKMDYSFQLNRDFDDEFCFRRKSANFDGISNNKRFGIWFFIFTWTQHVFIDKIWTSKVLKDLTVTVQAEFSLHANVFKNYSVVPLLKFHSTSIHGHTVFLMVNNTKRLHF